MLTKLLDFAFSRVIETLTFIFIALSLAEKH